ncbi:MAG: ankyrin repeat domain-containing protein [Alphaproteobacteria bacterium]
MGQNKDLDRRLLQIAAEGNAEVARQLVKEGADPQARSPDGATGLHFAINYSEYNYTSKGREMLALFLNRGLDINTGDGAGATALHHASLDEGYHCRNKIDDLLNFGADLEARDKKGQTPLHHAARRGKKSDGVKRLLEAGAEVNARDEQGATPLHMAAARGDADVIKTLIGAGADICATTRDGKNVWDFAVEFGQDYQAQCLRAESVKQLRAARHKEIEQERERGRRLEEKAKDPWTLLAADRVSFSAEEKKIGYRLTEVFNFAARTYTQITHNLATRAEAVAIKTFDEFDDKTALERAFTELERLGGRADHAAIKGPVVEKPKKASLKIPGA